QVRLSATMKSSVFMCGLVLVLTLVHTGDGYKCYTCVGCDEVEDDTPTTEGKSCMKTTNEILGKKVVSRGPLPAEAEDTCSDVAGQQICNCNRDYCNGAFINTALLLPLIGLTSMHLLL
ncbi:unnamed protein product, partial [Meganyctiphanes norvegica]